MIELNKLTLKNFLSHVDTTLNLDSYRGLVLIEGKTKDGHYSSNGSGKSTLLEGIVYALTGDTLRGVGVNDVVNRNSKKDTQVSLDFSTDPTHNYAVTRYRKDTTYGDSLVLMKNGENVSKRVNKETQKLLEDTIGISYKILSSTMLLGEGLSSRFTQLSDPEKKSLIESTLNLSYDISAIRAKANNEISGLKLKKSNLEGRLSTLKELSSLDIAATTADVKELDNKKSELEIVINTLTHDRDEALETQKAINQKMSLLNTSISQLNSLESTLKMIDAEGVKYHQELLNMEQTECPHCTVCHQSLVSEESKEAFRQSYKDKITDVTNRMKSVVDSINALPQKPILVEKYEALSCTLNDISTNITDLNMKIQDSTNHYHYYKNQADMLRNNIKEYNDSVSDISTLEVEIKNIESDLLKYDYFYKLFSPTGIIVSILSDAIGYINSRLSTYSDVLLEKDYHIDFLKGKISLVDSKGSSYQSLSNGEKRRLDIAIQFSLHDYVHKYCGLSMNTVFIDEILDTLDDIGVDNIIEVLRMKIEYCQLKSIYVITHNNSLKDKFDNIITVEKNIDGDSYLN